MAVPVRGVSPMGYSYEASSISRDCYRIWTRGFPGEGNLSRVSLECQASRRCSSGVSLVLTCRCAPA